jgi:WD40 repeat protein
MLVIGLALCSSTVLAADSPGAISFEKDVAPIFVENCVGCHNANDKKGKYDMSTYDAMFKSPRNRALIVPGKPQESLMLLLLTGEEEPTMPKDAELLDPAIVAKVESWIRQGAKFDGPDRSKSLRDLVRGPAKPIATNYTTPTPASALAFHPGGALLAVAGYHEITLWDPSNGRLARRLPTNVERTYSIQFSGDGKLMAHAGGTPGEMGEVVVWNTASWTALKELVRTDDAVFSVAFSSDGKQVASGGSDRLFRIWNCADWTLIHQVENHADWLLAVTFSPDGTRLFTASRDKSAKIWDLTSKEPALTFPGHTDGVYGVGVSPDAKFAVSAGADKTLKFWNAAGEAKEIRSVAAHGDAVYAVLFAKSGKTVFTAGADRLLKAWNPADGSLVRQFQGHQDWVYAIALSADEKTIASGSWDGEIRVWETATGKMVTRFVAVPALAVSQVPSATKSAP